MKTLLVLTDLGAAAERVRHYAALLAGPLGARVVLLHVYQKATMTVEGSGKGVEYFSLDQTQRYLQKLADAMLVPTEVEVTDGVFADVLKASVERCQPMLVLLGYTPATGFLNGLLTNRGLPLVRNGTYPVVFVPETGVITPPNRLTLAIDGEPFSVTPGTAKAVNDIQQTWASKLTLLHVNSPTHQLRREEVVQSVVESGALADATTATYRQTTDETPDQGILRTVIIHPANLLVLVARHRSFLGELFHRSVTAHVLRRATTPVLLLPSAG